MSFEIQVDGMSFDDEPWPGQCLRSYLRDRGCREPDPGCDTGDCGACTVKVDGAPVHGCVYPAFRAEGRVVTTAAGLARDSSEIPGLLRMKLLRSPHAHARILDIDVSAALSVPGVEAVFTHRDTRLLDEVVCYRGQRLAAVVADTEAAAEAGRRAIRVNWQVLPAVIDPQEAIGPGEPLVHSAIGDVEAGFAEAAVVYEQTFRTSRVRPTSLESPCTAAWFDDDDRLIVRSDTQAPSLTRRALCALHDLPLDRMRVVAGRVGNGFDGAPELLGADIVVTAALALHRPVRLEDTRAEQFHGATARNSLAVHIKAGARADGRLTALHVRVVADLGASGKYGPTAVFRGVGESIAAYRCPNKKIDGHAVHTNTVPYAALPGYGLGPVVFGMESVMDELARRVSIDPLEFRQRNMSGGGVDQHIAMLHCTMADPFPDAPPGWLIGCGSAVSMTGTTPPDGRCADARITLLPNGSYEMLMRTTEYDGDTAEGGTATMCRRIAAQELATTADRVTARRFDTGVVHGTSEVADTATADRAVRHAAQELAARLRALAATHLEAPVENCYLTMDSVRSGHRRISLQVLRALALAAGEPVAAEGYRDGTPRSAAFAAQLFHVAANPGTGELRILRSVHVTDAGSGMEPPHRRRVEAGVAQAVGATVSDHVAAVDTVADMPRTEVAFTRAWDSPGVPWTGSPVDPVAPALANALRDATGIRFTELPLTRDRIWLALHRKYTRQPVRIHDVATPTRAELTLLTDYQVP
ncbi:molybdopterin cofactor-binding domain-containing protein [Nocardia sp. NPDC059240]|uniref:molybdopterin cofactor-binding domain-containing protein n=1 Tax=Nocardia sp. NPDC059240 TaxID=3346786 RepID=UPI003674EB9B